MVRNSNEKSSLDRLLVSSLLFVGLVELPTIQEYGECPELGFPVSDDYVNNMNPQGKDTS